MRPAVRLNWIAITVAMALVGGSALGATPAVPAEQGLVLYIWKSQRLMTLARDGQPVREFQVKLGTNPYPPKRWRGDGATPQGRYFIREKRANSRFHRFLGLNYPNLEDADQAIEEGLIDQFQWSDIFFANMQRRLPPPSTPLGGHVGIHGYGGRPVLPIDWTKGCIAVTDDEIDYLYNNVELGTPVIIYE